MRRKPVRKICIHCGNEVTDGAKFCAVCGASTADAEIDDREFCPNCGTELPKNHGRFCSQCGEELLPYRDPPPDPKEPDDSDWVPIGTIEDEREEARKTMTEKEWNTLYGEPEDDPYDIPHKRERMEQLERERQEREFHRMNQSIDTAPPIQRSVEQSYQQPPRPTQPTYQQPVQPTPPQRPMTETERFVMNQQQTVSRQGGGLSETERFMMEQQANAAMKQAAKAEKSAKSDAITRVICIVLAVTLVLELLVAGFVRPGWFKKNKGTVLPTVSTEKVTELKTDKQYAVTVGEDGRAKADNGVSVDLTDSLDVGENNQLTVTAMKESYSEDADAYYTAYDISLGDVHQLDGYAEIRIPYTTDHIDAGEDPAQCVAAMYFNEDTDRWEPTLYEVDEANSELVIHTDHFSMYGCFNFKNKGRRMAKIVSIHDWELFDEGQALEAMREYLNDGEPGKLCHDFAKPYAESFLRGLGVQTTNDMTVYSNTANLLYGLGMGVTVDKAIEGCTPTRVLWKQFSNAGIACAAISIGLQIAKEDKSRAEVANIYKDATYLMISVSGDTILGIAGSAVWFVDYALSEMNNYAYNKVQDDLKQCYRWYMEKPNRWHTPRTMKEWRKLFKSICEENAGKQDEELDELIMEEIDNYCGEFWRSEHLWEVYDELGQTGRGLPSDAMKQDITNEFKGELMDSLSSVLRAVENDLRYDMYLETQKRLNAIRDTYNTKFTIQVKENVKDGEKSKYAGYSAYLYAPKEDRVTDTDEWDWTLTLDDAGCAETKVTWIGYVLAGCPEELWLYPKGKEVGGEPEKKVKFNIQDGTTVIPLGEAAVDLNWFEGAWYSEEYPTMSYTFEILEGDRIKLTYRTSGDYGVYEDYNYKNAYFTFDAEKGIIYNNKHTWDPKTGVVLIAQSFTAMPSEDGDKLILTYYGENGYDFTFKEPTRSYTFLRQSN